MWDRLPWHITRGLLERVKEYDLQPADSDDDVPPAGSAAPADDWSKGFLADVYSD